jgi:predicted polyphosphate/ATP-dependent NAD kinase
VGLVVNPLAGLGGSLALKGSDGIPLQELAARLPPEQRHRARDRAVRALGALEHASGRVRFTAWAGPMGADALQLADLEATVLGHVCGAPTTAADTRQAVRELVAAGVDILLFAGGDGTARDVCDAVGEHCPVLGIPAGVKMHSGVFAVSPEAAGEMLARLARGGLVGVRAQEVRDIDETAFRRGVVNSRFYGAMLVPGDTRFLQQTKVGGREDEQLAAADIAAWQAETMGPGRLYLIGPGSTTAAIMAELQLPNTLLGVDAVRDGLLLHADADADTLLGMLEENDGPASIVVTAIGGQGHLFGRGNQQFTPRVIRAVRRENIIVVAAKSKITGLGGRPLLVDTNDPDLDRELCGLWRINTGYDDYLLYRVGSSQEVVPAMGV